MKKEVKLTKSEMKLILRSFSIWKSEFEGCMSWELVKNKIKRLVVELNKISY